MSPSPSEWRDRLLRRYVSDVSVRADTQAIYESVQPFVPVLDRYKSTYSRLLEQSRTPWGRLVVDIVAERLKVIGFRNTGGDDAELWELMRRNKIENVQKDVHREALSTGTSYVSVWDDGGGTKIKYESSLHVTHENSPGDASVVAAAIKVWHDDVEGYMRCNVYLPGMVVKYISAQEVNDPKTWFSGINVSTSDKEWVVLEEVLTDYESVIMVPFVTHPTWSGYGRSDLNEVASVISRIETMTLNTLLAIELGAFRQKWATGIEIPKDEDGNDLEPYKAALDRLWISEDPEAKFGVFQDTDVRPYLQAVEDAIGQLSAVSRIPALYFNQSGLSNPPSASSLEASETGLVNKVIERRDRYSESWETVVQLVLGFDDVPDTITTLWKDPRTQSEAQVADAAVKLSSIGVPWEILMEYLGYTPSEITRMTAMRAADTFNQLLNTPLPQATPLVFESPAQVVEPPVSE